MHISVVDLFFYSFYLGLA